MLHEVKINGNRYCGPTSLSALTGHSTSYITSKVRNKFAVQRVRGMHTRWCLWYMNEAGLSYTEKSFRKPCNLRNWHSNYARRDITYFVALTTHFVVIRNGMIVCTQFKGVAKPIALSKHLRKQVQSVYEIKGTPNPEIVQKKPRDAKEVKNMFLAKKLIKHFNIDLEVEKMEGYTNYWTYWPEQTIDNKFGGDDPWEDNHIAEDWKEVVDKITAVAEEYNLPMP